MYIAMCEYDCIKDDPVAQSLSAHPSSDLQTYMSIFRCLNELRKDAYMANLVVLVRVTWNSSWGGG